MYNNRDRLVAILWFSGCNKTETWNLSDTPQPEMRFSAFVEAVMTSFTLSNSGPKSAGLQFGCRTLTLFSEQLSVVIIPSRSVVEKVIHRLDLSGVPALRPVAVNRKQVCGFCATKLQFGNVSLPSNWISAAVPQTLVIEKAQNRGVVSPGTINHSVHCTPKGRRMHKYEQFFIRDGSHLQISFVSATYVRDAHRWLHPWPQYRITNIVDVKPSARVWGRPEILQ